VALAPRFSIPLCIVTGKATATPRGVGSFATALPHTPEVVWLEGTQFDFYDNPQTVRTASDHAISHLAATLA